MADDDLQYRITELINEEHRLRDSIQQADLDPDAGRERLRIVETELDRLWDLLRQRRAHREFPGDAPQPHVRSEGTVEGYQQ